MDGRLAEADDEAMTQRLRSDESLTKSDLIEILAKRQSHLAVKDVELAVKGLLEQMSAELASGERIEIRGFGSFSLHFRGARIGRNPKSGDTVALRGKNVPHFKPGKELRERVNNGSANDASTNGLGDDREVHDDDSVSDASQAVGSELRYRG